MKVRRTLSDGWYAVAVYTIGGIGIAFCLGGVLYSWPRSSLWGEEPTTNMSLNNGRPGFGVARLVNIDGTPSQTGTILPSL